MRLKTPEERLAFAIEQAESRRREMGMFARRLAMLAVTMVGVAVLGSILAGCPKPQPEPARPDAADAAPPASCAQAAANIELLGCSGAAEAFAHDCPRIQRTSYRACVAAAPSCAVIDACD